MGAVGPDAAGWEDPRPMARLIDTGYLGRDRTIGAWERDGVIVDPGPASTADAVLAGLGDTELRAILLTHIHLDHAGAAGTLIGRFPEARVFVHEVGAPHLIDPSRLWNSAARLYGARRMTELWGEMLPVDPRRVTALSGGERVEGTEVLATPGHAGHHVVYLDEADGSAYVGDVAGVRIPPADLTLMPTPPPEIDVEAWLRSLDALADRRPESLRLAHFGEAADAEAQLLAARESLQLTAGWARDGDRDRFRERLGDLIAAQPPESAERMRLVMPPEQLWLGLERYWRKRGEDDSR
jgi:glyoxylase-like metal-dependent hydrolase (beta-lactamase superfamily II)